MEVTRYLGIPSVVGGLHAAAAEELDDEELPHLANVVAPWSEHHVLEAVGQQLWPCQEGPAAALRVVRLEGLPRRLRRSQHHHRDHAQPELHHRPVPPGQLPQAPMGQRAELVQVAHHGQTPGARWHLLARAAARLPEEEQGQWEEKDG
jgi:hypothetical protein